MTASTKAKQKTENAAVMPPAGPVLPEQATASEAAVSTASATAATKRPEKLVGDSLKEYAEAHKGQGLTAEQLAIDAGYVVVSRETGEITANETAYSKALAIAFGFVPAPPRATRAKGGGRTLAYKVKSNAQTGTMAVTGAYLRELGMAPGTVFNIIVDKEAGELILQVAGPESDQA